MSDPAHLRQCCYCVDVFSGHVRGQQSVVQETVKGRHRCVYFCVTVSHEAGTEEIDAGRTQLHFPAGQAPEPSR